MVLDGNDQLVFLGRYFGYPDCCIEAFPYKSNNDPKIHKHQGFKPCEKCAKRIYSGEIKIEDLIKNRKQSTPYPLNATDYYEGLKAFEKHIKNTR